MACILHPGSYHEGVSELENSWNERNQHVKRLLDNCKIRHGPYPPRRLGHAQSAPADGCYIVATRVESLYMAYIDHFEEKCWVARGTMLVPRTGLWADIDRATDARALARRQTLVLGGCHMTRAHADMLPDADRNAVKVDSWWWSRACNVLVGWYVRVMQVGNMKRMSSPSEPDDEARRVAAGGEAKAVAVDSSPLVRTWRTLA